MELALHRPLFFDPHVATRGEKKSATDAGSEAGKDKRLFCAACRYPITHQHERVSVGGSHEHTCTNPAGSTFKIGCFHDAGGCAAVGESTMEHTWFKGYFWQVALCASCERHIGWRFQASADYFHGLIVDRLSPAAGVQS